MVQVRMDIKAKMHDEGLSKEEKKTLKDQAARYKLILNTNHQQKKPLTRLTASTFVFITTSA